MTENVQPHRHPQIMLDFYQRKEREIASLKDEFIRAFLLRFVRALRDIGAKK